MLHLQRPAVCCRRLIAPCRCDVGAAIAAGAGDAQLPKAFLDFAIYAIVGVGAVLLVRLPPSTFRRMLMRHHAQVVLLA
jgi:hypothetical protein